MPAEPDSRTDIYSLGIVFWTLLAQQPAFDGVNPMEIIQGVIGRRLPPISSIRMDIPDVISRIIQKMTAKTINERYHSASGLRHDLVEVQKLIGAGDSAALRNWKIATKDVSSFFILPTTMVGREAEHEEIVKIIDKVSKLQMIGQLYEGGSYGGTTSSGSNLSSGCLEEFNAAIGAKFSEMSSDGTGSSAEISLFNTHAKNSLKHSVTSDTKNSQNGSSAQARSSTNSIHNSFSSHDSSNRSSLAKPWERLGLSVPDLRSPADGGTSESGQPRSIHDNGVALDNRNMQKKFRRKGRCEVVSIAGSAGLGK